MHTLKEQSVILYEAELNGILNDELVHVLGSGFIHEDEGITAGSYSICAFPRSVDPRFLVTCLITGYPNVTLDDGLRNPCKLVESYQYDRSLSAENGTEVKLKTEVNKSRGRLISNFTIDGKINGLSSIDEISDITEYWDVRRSSIEGHFACKFTESTNIETTVNAVSSYHLDCNYSQRKIRKIYIQASMKDSTLFLHQFSRSIDVD